MLSVLIQFSPLVLKIRKALYSILFSCVCVSLGAPGCSIQTKSRITSDDLTQSSAATRLSLHPALAWIFRKTRSFPSLARTRFGFLILCLNFSERIFYLVWPLVKRKADRQSGNTGTTVLPENL